MMWSGKMGGGGESSLNYSIICVRWEVPDQACKHPIWNTEEKTQLLSHFAELNLLKDLDPFEWREKKTQPLEEEHQHSIVK